MERDPQTIPVRISNSEDVILFRRAHARTRTSEYFRFDQGSRRTEPTRGERIGHTGSEICPTGNGEKQRA